jgi:hypothetical protein
VPTPLSRSATMKRIWGAGRQRSADGRRRRCSRAQRTARACSGSCLRSVHGHQRRLGAHAARGWAAAPKSQQRAPKRSGVANARRERTPRRKDNARTRRRA